MFLDLTDRAQQAGHWDGCSRWPSGISSDLTRATSTPSTALSPKCLSMRAPSLGPRLARSRYVRAGHHLRLRSPRHGDARHMITERNDLDALATNHQRVSSQA